MERGAHGERYREWRSVFLESSQEHFRDTPREGPLTALHMAKAMHRAGGLPKLWLEKFLREQRIEQHDRIAHELRCIC